MTQPSDPHAPHRGELPERPPVAAWKDATPEDEPDTLPHFPPLIVGEIGDVIGFLEQATEATERDEDKLARDFAVIALDKLGQALGLYGLADRLAAVPRGGA